ncbi:SAM-dependent DNA methyltransferase [Pseudomonas aeruginosa]|uniref:N-6 DNA methylase n=1 Tax=Pseudomonas aeruginosa TaxID=287 RepID=UPI000FC40DE7|nr:N-6 DNA methylase [Pseudomonas aeruginosa]RUG38126.1 SAM-dependent DNA methyltransferase [Pseudomonas aeruginosa]
MVDGIKNLKQRIFDITKGLPLGDRESKDLAMKSFISYGYEIFVKAFWVSNVDVGKDVDFFASEAWHADLSDKIDSQALADAMMLYTGLVASSEPFSDVLSRLYEEILLDGRGGDGKAQFFTPEDLSKAIARLLLPMGEINSWRGVKRIGDDTCGSGSLPMGCMNRIYKVNKSKLKYVSLHLNDIDELACKAAALQILSCLVIHRLKVNAVHIHNCNVITEWRKPKTLMFAFKRPEPNPNEDLFKMMDLFSKVCDEIKKEEPIFQA